ncbi:MAG: PadR family transcriptional regulator [candidate division WS1 bacterium]|jgi:DNA-binding PadR family transcriptional regulator|nr:PadR family transcriptional regulator [candidate division WS1 bacterium]
MRRRGQASFDDLVASRLSRLIEPAVLYLLGTGAAAHGYDLLSEVNELALGEAQVDPGAVYRVLRQLETEGAVVSSWDTAGGGPARRNYELTDVGRARLASWVTVIARRADAMQRFAEQAQKLLEEK